ncbi:MULTISPECIES: hypothetical protein [unclassified Thioalkalivibrio]|uniref:hypothetical protein n=1 Tax=unclassified Thioalkalivibrio TaxID=2621013 RepID=UPI00039BF4A4|nr:MULTISPECIES: hypothetical protein [unclassified Thioalkalivibrio]
MSRIPEAYEVSDGAGVTIPAQYAESWEDGFGVRGWKLDLPGRGADVIAATPYTGERIPTSVFVHDIVDHHLCGFALSGYVDEAGALIQLAERTGSDPVADFVQIIDEDLLPGLFESDDWRELLPDSLVAEVEAAPDARSGMARLRELWGDGVLRALWIAGFVETGWGLAARAREAWERHGLDYARRAATARALQRLFERVDATVLDQGWSRARGVFRVAPAGVGFRFEEPAEGRGEYLPVTDD